MRFITKEDARAEFEKSEAARYRARLRGAVEFWRDDYQHKLTRTDYFSHVPAGGLTEEDYKGLERLDLDAADSDHIAAALLPFVPHMLRLDVHRTEGLLSVVKDWTKDHVHNGKTKSAGRAKLGRSDGAAADAVSELDYDKLLGRYKELAAVHENALATKEQRHAAYVELDHIARSLVDALAPLEGFASLVDGHTHRLYPEHAGRVHAHHAPRTFGDVDFECSVCGRSPDRMLELKPNQYVCPDCLGAK